MLILGNQQSMEKTNEGSETSLTFSDELSAIYELIRTYRSKASTDNILADKNKSRSLAFIAATVVLLIIAGLYLAVRYLPHTTWGDSTESIRLVLQLIVLLTYVLGGVTVLFQYLSLKDFYKDFTGEVIGFASEASKEEAELFEGLNELSTESIKYVANRLENSSTQLGQIRAFLLGAIEKIGIIPGLLATLIAIYNVANTAGFSWVEMLSFLMVGIYLSMFPITEASMKIKRLSTLLNQYLVLFRSNSSQKKDIA